MDEKEARMKIEKLNLVFTTKDIDGKTKKSRGPLMTSHVTEAVSTLRPGTQFTSRDLLNRIPKAFLESSYPSLDNALLSVRSCLAKMDKSGKLMGLPGGIYVVQRVSDAVPEGVNRTRAACLHMRHAFLNGISYLDMVEQAPEELRSLYEGDAGLKRAFLHIADKIVKMTDEEFATFYTRLDDVTETASPLRQLG